MYFGETTLFAVQLELDENSGGEWLFGKICFWIGGDMVGDFQMGTSLRDVFSQLKWIPYDNGKRYNVELCGKAPDEIFRILNSTLYDTGDEIASVDIPETPARFDVNISVDVFDDWKIFMIDCPSHSTILFKRVDDHGPVKTCKIPLGFFDVVIEQLQEHLTGLYDKETEHGN